MAEQIKDGTGRNDRAMVTTDFRLASDSIIEPISSERSRNSKLWGLGTGFLTIPQALGASSPLMWFKNDTNDEQWYVVKIIAGHTGAQTNPADNVGIATLIKYGATAPNTNTTAIYATVENISTSVLDDSASDTTGTRKDGFEGYKWNETGTAGFSGGSGGFYQIPNSWAIGNTTAPIDGEIILGPGDSMQFDHMNNNMQASDTMEFHISVVFYTVQLGKERGTE